MSGLLEPHVFARFQQVLVQLDLDLLKMHSPWKVTRTMEVVRNPGVNLEEFLRNCDFGTNLAHLLSKSSVIRKLALGFRVQSIPAFDWPVGWTIDQHREISSIIKALGKTAVMDSGVLNPLRHLSNVKVLRLGPFHGQNRRSETCKRWSDERFDDLIRIVEHNWAVRFTPGEVKYADPEVKSEEAKAEFRARRSIAWKELDMD